VNMLKGLILFRQVKLKGLKNMSKESSEDESGFIAPFGINLIKVSYKSVCLFVVIILNTATQ
jgi:hypothetical protein